MYVKLFIRQYMKYTGFLMKIILFFQQFQITVMQICRKSERQVIANHFG